MFFIACSIVFLGLGIILAGLFIGAGIEHGLDAVAESIKEK